MGHPSLGVPELLTHRVPETMEPQTIVSTRPIRAIAPGRTSGILGFLVDRTSVEHTYTTRNRRSRRAGAPLALDRYVSELLDRYLVQPVSSMTCVAIPVTLSPSVSTVTTAS